MSLFGLALYLTLLNSSIVSILWGYCKTKERLDFIFAYWGLGIVIMSWSAMVIEGLLEDPSLHLRQLIVNILISLWGIRLSLHITKRKFWIIEDPRYTNLKNNMGKTWMLKSYKKIFLPLALLQLLVMSPIISLNFLPGSENLNFLDFLGIVIFMGGFTVEFKADHALKKFRQRAGNKSKVLKEGLWSYCRHPNYFGDILQWWGLYLIACNAIGGGWSFYGPFLMTMIFLKISIKNVENREVLNRPDYGDYVDSTNKLFPELPEKYKKIFVWWQNILPHKLITIIAGYFYRSKNIFLKSSLINIFCFLYKPNLNESERTDKKEYKSFNDLFTRKLKPEARPINFSESKVISPVDGVITSFGEIKDGTLFQAKKNKYKLEDLLKNKHIEEVYKEGYYVTIYLAPSNYHRIHFPLDGTIKETKYFPGSLFSVKKSSLKTLASLYTKNERALIQVESKKISYCLISVGALMVGRIVPFWLKNSNLNKKEILSAWSKGPQENLSKIKKGKELGYFEMGSTIILLLSSSVKLNNNFLSESKAVKFGEVLIDLMDK